MDDAPLARRLEHTGDLTRDRDRRLRAEGAAAQPDREILTLNELHDQPED